MFTTIKELYDSHFNFGRTPYEWEASWRASIGESEQKKGKCVISEIQDKLGYLDKAKLSRLPLIQERLPDFKKDAEICVVIPNPIP